MVNTEQCNTCGGLGRIMTLDEPPDDLGSDEGWAICPRCRGAKVEMAKRRFEVYFVFDDEAQARGFMDSASPTSARERGIRRVQGGHLDMDRPVAEDETGR